MSGRISGLVAALESELSYYRGLAKEQQEIIEQLHRGYPEPGKVVYIHPADFAELVNKLPISCFFLDRTNEKTDPSIHNISGIWYKQSASMPQITTKFR